MGNGEKLTHIKLMLGKEYCKQIDASFAEFKERMQAYALKNISKHQHKGGMGICKS